LIVSVFKLDARTSAPGMKRASPKKDRSEPQAAAGVRVLMGKHEITVHLIRGPGSLVEGTMEFNKRARARVRGFRHGNHVLVWDDRAYEDPDGTFMPYFKKDLFIVGDRVFGTDGDQRDILELG
jgi:hypothetical protein